jgi:hypothetical protein
MSPRGRKRMDAPTVIFVAALIAASAGVLAGLGGLWLAREQAATERAMRQRLEGLVEEISGGDSYVYLEPLRRAGRVRYFLRQTGQQTRSHVSLALAAVVLLTTDN